MPIEPEEWKLQIGQGISFAWICEISYKYVKRVFQLLLLLISLNFHMFRQLHFPLLVPFGINLPLYFSMFFLKNHLLLTASLNQHWCSKSRKRNCMNLGESNLVLSWQPNKGQFALHFAEKYRYNFNLQFHRLHSELRYTGLIPTNLELSLPLIQ